MNDIIQRFGFIKYLLENGAEIAPLEINYDEVETLASMNPSIWITNDGIGYINVRAVNYNLFDSRYREFTQDDQPTAYVCKDTYHLKTENYFGTINIDTLEINDISKVQMMNLHDPVWQFWGLEDARVIKWDENIYLCGVRRDIKENGEGRMELSKIENIDNTWTETERVRIPAADDDTAYLEKNWMPIVDKPWNWLKWSSPIEFAYFNIDEKELKITFTGDNAWDCYRGDSHLVKIDDNYYCFVHLVDNMQLRPETNARIAIYLHSILKFDSNLHYIGNCGTFMYDKRIPTEFGCGLAIYNDTCYLTYSENDAAAYIVKFNKELITNLEYIQ